MDLVMVFTILPMVVMLTMERDLPMLNPRPMLTPTFFMVVMLTMERDLPMLNPRPMLTPTFFLVVMDILVTMARGLLMPSPRLMLILTFSMVDITDLDMPDMDFTILPMVVMLTMARGQ